MTADGIVKPLGRKSYGSIGHLPGSRLGPGDNHVNEGQARCMTEALPRKDRLIVQEKLDGSNVGVCKVGGKIHAIGRAGWPADSSPREQHQLFADWVREHEVRFDAILGEGERVCGEWLAQAHGTRYELRHEPFVAFDVYTPKDERLTYGRFLVRALAAGLATPWVLHSAEEAFPLDALPAVTSRHGAEGGVPEGFVYRWERGDRVLMLAKWVRPEKKDGCYLDSEGHEPVWNWRPTKEATP